MTTIADELEDRLWYLADPAVVWVNHLPHNGQSCLILDAQHSHDHIRDIFGMSKAARLWLEKFLDVDCQSPAIFNDHCRTRDEVLWMLEEAVEQARWEGV